MPTYPKSHVARALGFVALASASLLTSVVHAQSAVDVAPPVYPPPSARWKVFAAGIGTTAVTYGAAVGASYLFPDAPGTGYFRAPIVGPWLALGHSGCAADDPNCSTVITVVRTVLTIVDGIAQAGGLAVAMEGLFMPTQESTPGRRPPPPSAPSPTREPPGASPPTQDAPKNLFFVPTPMTVGTRGIGLGVVGRF